MVSGLRLRLPIKTGKKQGLKVSTNVVLLPMPALSHAWVMETLLPKRLQGKMQNERGVTGRLLEN
jgi:hypothetical protein